MKMVYEFTKNKHKNILSTGTYKENALTLQSIFPLFNKVEWGG